MDTPTCAACSMPMTSPEMFGNMDPSSKTCVYCTNPDGSVKACSEIFEGGVQFFLQHVGNDRGLAERLTRKNMQNLPLWQDSQDPCLQGEVASETEFNAFLQAMGGE